ncbi:tetratricopeptide repeat protein [Treponema phagedenis]|uniref:Tetratricopeptide repeat protein n=1 Tax=Treponema phagedenis TaxID=162 RepID=A0A0B7GV29_TREPH|nr:tetratricopeptide repeat protein [Treponema phagedenis]NVP25020.1 tetratricopeptide repeat protein [Treponema phagedenis]QEJ94065.1 tetratricopeptide repeat protein [Treponema phagedenis]QEJ97135.1 tetratricopeptide repeat protein [Treponema phagedenis]QEK01925.1 tetratricopeptide repeat protein [Treponema phagedenis]QEK02675.1 tetratricopeptide repeat protein [Treponema phagedenis]
MSAVIISFSIIVMGFAVIMIVVLLIQKRGNGGFTKKKSKPLLMKEATRRLAQNPRDPQGLSLMGDLYFQDQDWEKAFSTYSVFLDHCNNLPISEQFTVMLRYGICAIKTGRMNDAKKGFLLAKNINPQHFDVNYNLGYIHYFENNYDQSVPFLRKALIAQPNNILAAKYLGYSFQKIHKYQEALPYLKKVLDVQPDDKEALFAMGECFYEAGANERALKIFNHLRLDPVLGPQAALYSGIIRTKLNQIDKAVMDFEIGLKHENINLEIVNELRYRLAQVLIKTQDLGRALASLKEIQHVSPGYKDVASLIMRYQELNQNKNLHIYMMAGQSEFVGLCRKIVSKFFPYAKVKILDISVLVTHTDIVAEIDTPKWADLVIFRFFRSQGAVGELILRDFYGRIKELKAGKGICMTAGTFTEEAGRFGEGRPVDLYDKKRLNKILNTLG